MKIKLEKGKVPDQTGFYLIGHNRGKDQFIWVEVVNWNYYWSDKMEIDHEPI